VPEDVARHIPPEHRFSLCVIAYKQHRTCGAWGGSGKVLPTHSIRDGKAKLSRSAIKVWKEDPTAVETQGEEIKRHYSQILRV